MEKSERVKKERMGLGVLFSRIRRLTEYLTGDLKTWNNAKKAEEKDRVKHGLGFTATEGFFDLLMGKDEEEDEK